MVEDGEGLCLLLSILNYGGRGKKGTGRDKKKRGRYLVQ